MRRALIGVVVLGVLVAGAAWFLRAPPPAGTDVATAAQPRPLPEFRAVDVRAQSQGLTLTGLVKDPQGRPVPGAEVFLASSVQASINTHTCGFCQEPVLGCPARETALEVAALLGSGRGELVAGAHTTADEKGAFRFEQLAGVSFTVWARAAGFGDGVHERAAPGDPVEIYLPPARTITGRLLDERGQGVAGRVWAVSEHLARYLHVEADAQGRFALQSLGEGPFAVLAEAPGKLPVLRAAVEAGGEALTLRLSDPRTLEVAVTQGGVPAEATVHVTGDHLDRMVVATKGLAQLKELYPDQLSVTAALGAQASAPQVVTLTELTTRVALELEAGGRVAATVLDEAEAPVANPTLSLLSPAGEVLHQKRAGTGELVLLGPVAPGDYLLKAEAEGFTAVTQPVQVKAGETRLDLTLARGTVISGRVLDEYGRPAPRISVLITPTGDSVHADAEGRFVAVVPSPGQYGLHAHHSDWGGGELTVSAPKSGVELQLEPKAGARVVVSADGKRIEGASVSMFIDREGSFRNDRTSGADGVVLMRGLPPGKYTLIASHPEFLPAERQVVTINDGQLLEVTAELRAGAAVSGQVVDTSGVPVTGASVSVTPRGAEPAVTDADGKFSLSPLRPKGIYALRVVGRGLEQPERTTAVAGGEPVKIVVRRQPIFRGRVVSDGKPVRHFRIDEHEVESSDGRFELPLPATEDRVIFTVEAPGYEPLVVDRPRVPDLGDLVLRAAPKLVGVVKDEQGAPVADAVVGCDVCEQQTRSSEDGRFTLAKPPFVSEFTVVARKGRRSGSAVVAQLDDSVQLSLRAGTRVSGGVYSADGRPQPGVEIQGLQAERGEPVSVVTGADGRYSVDVPPGVYRFVVATPGQRGSEDPLAQIVQVGTQEVVLDFGLAPGSAPVVVHVRPQRGFALWLVRGEVTAIGNPPMELLRSSWAQLVYQPLSERVVFPGVPPGRYSLVWASFHAETPGGPAISRVDVPSSAEVSLVR
ncbi:MAG: carboxypeptidase regulatory-like domain-containing protein [Myxococcaceae bacterium]|nr:carboxypeptidase regulatory-like domain-containing protein [Myxococcaceae bacterium]